MKINPIGILNFKTANKINIHSSETNFKGQSNSDDFFATLSKNKFADEPYDIEEYNIMRSATESMINFMKEQADARYNKIPESKRDGIPLFFDIQPGAYLAKFDRSTKIGLAQIEMLKKEKRDDLFAIFDKAEKSSNYQKMMALEAGFEHNPQKVFDILSDNVADSCEPVVVDMGNGIIKYAYNNGQTVAEYTKNAETGEYIDFSIFSHENITGIFNKNGSIKKLSFTNHYDYSNTTIIPDKDGNVSAINKCSNLCTVKNFKRQDYGIYKFIKSTEEFV